MRALYACGCGLYCKSRRSRFCAGHHMKGMWDSFSKEKQETIRKRHSTASKKVWKNTAYRRKLLPQIIARVTSQSFINKRRKNHVAGCIKRSADLQYRAALKVAVNTPRMKALRRKFGIRSIRAKKLKPNGAELALRQILNNLFPRQFVLNVRAKKLVGGKIPDFVHRRLKLVVEMFGNYYHGEYRTGRSKREEESKRIRELWAAGYYTVIIWESELSNPDVVRKRVRRAMYKAARQ